MAEPNRSVRDDGVVVLSVGEQTANITLGIHPGGRIFYVMAIDLMTGKLVSPAITMDALVNLSKLIPTAMKEVAAREGAIGDDDKPVP